MCHDSECCQECCNILFFGICFIVYIVYNIIFLEEYYDQWISCNGNNLWAYVLCSFCCLIFTFLHAQYINNITRNALKCIFIANILLFCGMTLWGIIELFHIKWIHPFRKYEICDELKDSQLWDMGLANFIFIILVGINYIDILSIHLYYYPEIHHV